MSERGTPAGKRSSLMMLVLLLVSLFAVGCGDSGEDFVVQGNNANNNPQVPTTTVNFQFARAQANITANVPLATTRLHIDFLTSSDQEVFETEVDFAPTVSVSPVPITATQAVVTALDRNNIPLRTIFYSLTLSENETFTAVPLGPGFPVTFQSVTASPNPLSLAINGTQQLALSVDFSNGNSLSGTAAGGTATFSSANNTIANVTSTGLVRGRTNGTTTISVVYTLNNVTRSTSVPVTVGNGGGGGGTTGTTTGNTTGTTTGNTTGTTTGNTTGTTTGNTTGTTTGNTTGGTPASLDVTPASLTLAPGVQSGGLTARFTPANTTTSVEVTTIAGQLSNFNPAQFDPSVTPGDATDTITYNPSTRSVTAGTNVLPGATATLTLTFLFNGQNFTDTVAITVGSLAQASAVTGVEIASITGDTLNLVQTTEYPISIAEVRADGNLTFLDWSLATTQARFDLVPGAGPAIATFTKATGQLALNAAGQGTVFTLRENPTPGGLTTATNRDSFTLNSEALTAGQSSSVTFDQASYPIRQGQTAQYRVTLITPTGRRTDLTSVFQVTSSLLTVTPQALGTDPTPTTYTLQRGVLAASPAAAPGSTGTLTGAPPADLIFPAGSTPNPAAATINVLP